MIWHIAKREIHHNLITLRFMLLIILLPILMVVNALIYGYGEWGGYTHEVNDYNRRIAQRLAHIERYATKSLAELATMGPGDIPKYPSPLKFCADGASEVIPLHVTMQSSGTRGRGSGTGIEGYSWRDPWTLEYPSSNYQGNLTRLIKIDWVLIGILMAFFAILFTFDAIAGERERGTLSLMMSNMISRGQILLGKYLGAFLTLMVPLLISVLINLLLLYLSRNIPFDSNTWLRIMGMLGLFALLVSLFIFLGLFFSSRVSNAITSLAFLLLIWVCLTFVFPPLVATFVSNVNPVLSIDDVSLRRQVQLAQIEDEFRPMAPLPLNKLQHAASVVDADSTRLWAAYLSAVTEAKTQIADGHCNEQFRQVQTARKFAQFSPVVTFQYAMEACANTGFVSYYNFVNQVRRYRQTFIDFIKSEDRADLESLHIYPVKEGLSQKLVNPKAVPVFDERTWDRSVFVHIGILILFNLLFFIFAEVSFLRSDVR